MAMIPSMFGGRRSSSIFDPLSFDIWDPFEGNGTLLTSVPRETSAFATAQIDWRETPEAHIFKADLPGLRKEEAKVEVEVEDGRVLKISGERTMKQEEKKNKWRRVERSTGKSLRRFRLPENARMDQVKASLENGVLNVIVPKEKERTPEVKAINMLVKCVRGHGMRGLLIWISCVVL